MAKLTVTATADLGLTTEEAEVALRQASAHEFKLPVVDLVNGPIIPEAQLNIEALYGLLVQKGIITEAEDEEAVRLRYNSDLARREAELGQEFR